MSAIVDAIDTQIADHEAKLDQLRALRESAVEIESSAAEVRPISPRGPSAPAARKSRRKPAARKQRASKPPPLRFREACGAEEALYAR